MGSYSAFEKRFRRPVDDDGEELLLGDTGEPVIVTKRGEFVGYRKRNDVFKPPERRIEDIPDTEWIWIGGGDAEAVDRVGTSGRALRKMSQYRIDGYCLSDVAGERGVDPAPAPRLVQDSNDQGDHSDGGSNAGDRQREGRESERLPVWAIGCYPALHLPGHLASR